MCLQMSARPTLELGWAAMCLQMSARPTSSNAWVVMADIGDGMGGHVLANVGEADTRQHAERPPRSGFVLREGKAGGEMEKGEKGEDEIARRGQSAQTRVTATAGRAE
jgi:hypothetical protein